MENEVPYGPSYLCHVCYLYDVCNRFLATIMQSILLKRDTNETVSYFIISWSLQASLK